MYSIVAEATEMFNLGYREVTLLGQNVDSYKWKNPETENTINFASLLENVAKIHPDLRIRFSTSHPKDITDEVLYMMAKYENICKYIHLPVQSGNSRVLKLMNRTYDRAWYKERVESIYRIIPDCAISSDIITGFCSETEEEHKDTLSIIEWAKYSMSYMFFYSERPGTLAAKKYEDDIPLEVKKRRLSEVIVIQSRISTELNKKDIGKTFKVLIEGNSKKSENDWTGRNTQTKMIIFPKYFINNEAKYKKGDYVNVKVTAANSATLIGELV
jgi:tRNA-2-methylthio-N6-dimethylallyladenosine synthase